MEADGNVIRINTHLNTQQKYWLNYTLDLLMVIEEKSGDYQSQEINLLGTKFYDKPSNSCLDFSVWTETLIA